MFVVGHTVNGLLSENPEISFDIVGSTGNMYKTTIRKDPTCDCPDGKSGNQCKHICYGEPLMSPLLKVSASTSPSDYLYIFSILTNGMHSPCICSEGPRRTPVPAGFFDLGKVPSNAIDM